MRLQRTRPDHYAVLGLDRTCTTEQIRAAYRLLAKQLHPDVNRATPDAVARMQQLNVARETLSDPECRRAYDSELASARPRPRSTSHKTSLAQDVFLRIDEFLRGTTLAVRVNDPGHSAGPEAYSLIVPPSTAPGTRLTVNRDDGSKVVVRMRVRPDHRFKIRGSDLRCDLRISTQRVTQGGTEFVTGATGKRIPVHIPRGVVRGDILRVTGEGMPKHRGGRGDLLVRVMYRPEVRISRTSGH